MATKKTERIITPGSTHWVGDGFRVHNIIPGEFQYSMERTDPFILLDYNARYTFPPSDHPRGVGVHPHRGFETVTIAYKGSVAHHDSHGGGGVIGEGDVQWMTAASGVLHKEYHEKKWSEKGGVFQMAQLWVNLPAVHKMSAPKYQSITKEKLGKAILPEGAGFVEIIAGRYNDTTGPATTFTPLHLMNARLNHGGKVPFTFPAAYHTALLVIEGRIRVNENETIPVDHFVLFENKGEMFTIDAIEKSVVLIMSGEPINEPIAANGPFVMNTREELEQAYEDFYSGKFGYLEE